MSRLVSMCFVAVCFVGSLSAQQVLPTVAAEPYLIDDTHQLRGRVFPADLVSGMGSRPVEVANYRLQKRLMDVEFASLKQACNLDDRQEAQLDAAARGAVEAFVSESANRGARKQDAPNAQKDATKHPIWIDAVESLLSKEQRSRLAEARRRNIELATEADAQMRVAQAYKVVVLLDKALQLSNGQREAFLNTLSAELIVSEKMSSHVMITESGRRALFRTLNRKQRAIWDDLTDDSVIEIKSK